MAVRRVRRIIRKVDPWTVLKASLIFNAIAGLVFVLGMWVMWSLVIQKGIPEKMVDLFSSNDRKSLGALCFDHIEEKE